MIQEIEVWKEIKETNGIYFASNYGKIKTIDTFIREKNGKKRFQKGRILKPHLNKNRGYFYLSIRFDFRLKVVSVHRIIASTFIPKPFNKDIVNHINGIKTDNKITNLEWCNKSENEIHAYRVLGKINILKGSINEKKRRKIHQFDLFNNYIKSFDSITIASKETNTNRQKISDVAIGKRNQTNNYVWKYEI